MPGVTTIEEWRDWASGSCLKQEAQAAFPKTPHIPMMTARRMSRGARLAVEAGLEILERQQAKALVFSSRHGEIGRTSQIIQQIIEGRDTSPTDFAMSVHNTSAGLLTITAKAALPASSIASGRDSFSQALFEVAAFFAAGIFPVLLVDFDGELPEPYGALTKIRQDAYAVALLLTKGEDYHVSMELAVAGGGEESEPQSLVFFRNHLLRKSSFIIEGENRRWRWVSA